MNRWALFVGALIASLAITVFLWTIGLPGFFLFLAFPFFLLPFGSRRSDGRLAEDRTGMDPGRDRRFTAGAEGSDGGPRSITTARQGIQRRCPACGRRSQDPDERHCKRDGTLMRDTLP